MKKILFVLLSVWFFVVAAGPAQATLFNFSFDPNDLIDNYGFYGFSPDQKATQDDPRRVHDTWGGNFYQTFSDSLGGKSQPNSYNTYLNWRSSLGPGEGISRFNLWLLDNPAAQSWGEALVANTNYVPSGTADAANGWNVQVIANPWGAGYLVEWWTTDSSKYLRPGGADISNFSFTTDALYDSNGDGTGDTALVEGQGYRVWFGSGNGDYPDYSLWFDASGWGNLSPAYGPFAAGDSSGWEGVLDLKGAPVPEPATMLLLGAGLVGLAGFGRKKLFGKK